MGISKQEGKTWSSSFCLADQAPVFLQMITDVREYSSTTIRWRVGLGENWKLTHSQMISKDQIYFDINCHEAKARGLLFIFSKSLRRTWAEIVRTWIKKKTCFSNFSNLFLMKDFGASPFTYKYFQIIYTLFRVFSARARCLWYNPFIFFF